MAFLDIALRAVKLAGRIHMHYFGTSLSTTSKGEGDFYTRADIESEHAVMALLKQTYPSHAILSEESGKTPGSEDYCWVVDPLDGTPNYYRGNSNFCVLLALTHANRLILGVSWFPATQELFVAQKGQGSTKNGHRLSVSMTKDLPGMYGSTQLSSKEPCRSSTLHSFVKLSARTRVEVARGCIGRQLCDVAEGISDFHFRHGLHYWDYAAGTLLVQEAGGMATDLHGAPINAESIGVLVSNGQQHQQLMELLHR